MHYVAFKENRAFRERKDHKEFKDHKDSEAPLANLANRDYKGSKA